MRQLQIFLLILFSTTLLLTSCGKDDDGLVGADAGSGSLTATVNGTSWKSKNEANGAVYAESQGSHIIQAYHQDGSYISMTVFGAITSGATFEATNGALNAQYKPDFEKSEVFTASGTLGSAQITFSTFSESKVKGTFSFTGVMFDSSGGQTETEVKNGSFEFDL